MECSIIVSDTRKRILLVMHWFDQRLYAGVAEYAARRDWELVGSPHQTFRIPPAAGDGLLILPGPEEPYRRLIRSYQGRTVVMHAIPSDLRVPHVVPDVARMGCMAAEHLLERGFRNLAVLRLWREPFAEPAVDGFVEAIAQAGLPVHSEVMPGQDGSPADEHRYDRQLEWLMYRLRELPKPAGVFLPIDGWAVRALRACRQTGLHVPESVAVVGINNALPMCRFATVPLSSVDPNLETVGSEAARLLDRLMAGGSVPARAWRVEPRGVVARRSTDSLAIDDLRVARAVRYIRDHLSERPSCRDVALAAGTNLRTLQAAFRRHLRRGIGSEVIHWRMEAIKTLLRESDVSTQQVADNFGYSSVSVLYRQFKTETGVTMGQYRRRVRG